MTEPNSSLQYEPWGGFPAAVAALHDFDTTRSTDPDLATLFDKLDQLEAAPRTPAGLAAAMIACDFTIEQMNRLNSPLLDGLWKAVTGRDPDGKTPFTALKNVHEDTEADFLRRLVLVRPYEHTVRWFLTKRADGSLPCGEALIYAAASGRQILADLLVRVLDAAQGYDMVQEAVNYAAAKGHFALAVRLYETPCVAKRSRKPCDPFSLICQSWMNACRSAIRLDDLPALQWLMTACPADHMPEKSCKLCSQIAQLLRHAAAACNESIFSFLLSDTVIPQWGGAHSAQGQHVAWAHCFAQDWGPGLHVLAAQMGRRDMVLDTSRCLNTLMALQCSDGLTRLISTLVPAAVSHDTRYLCLRWAVADARTDFLKLLRDLGFLDGVPLDALCLSLAVRTISVPFLELVLEMLAPMEWFEEPLVQAAAIGKVALVELLLSTYQGIDAVRASALLQLLREQGCLALLLCLRTPGTDDATLLQLACTHRHSNAVQAIIASIDEAKRPREELPFLQYGLRLLVKDDNVAMLPVLLDFSFRLVPDWSALQLLYHAACAGNVEVLKAVAAYVPHEPNDPSEHLEAVALALLAAAVRASPQCCSVLVPLLGTAGTPRAQLLSHLAGAAFSVVEQQGFIPLVTVLIEQLSPLLPPYFKHERVFSALTQALIGAIEQGQQQIASLLLEAGAHRNAVAGHHAMASLALT